MPAPKPRVQELLSANRTFAETYTAPFNMKQMRERTGDRVLVLTCMDTRAVPEEFFGRDAKVAVLRNAGGRFSPDVVRSITVLRSLAHKSESFTVLVVHHTDCGMTHLSKEEIKTDIRARGGKGSEKFEDIEFGLFAADDIEAVTREDVEALQAQSVLDGVDVRGYILTTETGLLREVQ